jgi:hypothetical protein
MIDIEKMSREIFDEMRQIIGQNRISDQAFLSTIARGLHAAVEEDRAATAESLLESSVDLVAKLEAGHKAAVGHAVEQERVACAVILEIESRRYETGNPGPTERKVAELLLTLAVKIRARSEQEEVKK